VTYHPDLYQDIILGIKKGISSNFGTPGKEFTHILAPEPEGFILGPILAENWGLPFQPIRFEGKLPEPAASEEYPGQT
jgi:adenine/guanine phosphoribosyltransferase-like PRPP-binding protein